MQILTSVNQDHFPVMLKRSVSMFMVPMTVAVCQAMQGTVISLAQVCTVSVCVVLVSRKETVTLQAKREYIMPTYLVPHDRH